MTITHAVALLQRVAARKEVLALAERTTRYSRAIGELHREEGAAIRVVLAALSEDAR